jgi:hypothetical protein
MRNVLFGFLDFWGDIVEWCGFFCSYEFGECLGFLSMMSLLLGSILLAVLVSGALFG